ncbi:MAG: transcriptional activator RfaH [Alphaproteobacteria bacterium]|nr:transcriptional activator RfaH [Alphaproteobacteria bacterium]
MDRWYVVSTQPGAEAKAAQHLDRQGYRVYLPRWRKRRSHARRVDWIAAPLFPRYLFVGFDIETTRWRAINSTIGISHIICNSGIPAPLPDAVIADIRARETGTGLIEIESAFRKGQPVIVGEGPFLDQTGLFETMNDADRVTILLNLLGRELRVKMPVYSIRAA